MFSYEFNRKYDALISSIEYDDQQSVYEMIVNGEITGEAAPAAMDAPLLVAIKNNKWKSVRALIDTQKTWEKDACLEVVTCRNPVHLSIDCGAPIDIIEEICALFDVNTPDGLGRNAGHAFARFSLNSDNVGKICDIILRYGIDLDARDRDNYTPKELASSRGWDLAEVIQRKMESSVLDDNDVGCSNSIQGGSSL